MALNTALDAYQAFAQIEDSDRHQRLLGNLRTVLRRYVLPYYGINAKGRNGQLEAALAQLPIPRLITDANWFLQRLENPTSPDEQSGKLTSASPGLGGKFLPRTNRRSRFIRIEICAKCLFASRIRASKSLADEADLFPRYSPICPPQ